MKIKEEYDALLESGELLEIYPELSGLWKKDKKSFTDLWQQNQEAIKNIDVYLNEEDE